MVEAPATTGVVVPLIVPGMTILVGSPEGGAPQQLMDMGFQIVREGYGIAVFAAESVIAGYLGLTEPIETVGDVFLHQKIMNAIEDSCEGGGVLVERADLLAAPGLVLEILSNLAASANRGGVRLVVTVEPREDRGFRDGPYRVLYEED